MKSSSSASAHPLVNAADRVDSYTALDDTSLMALVVQGNHDAFAELVGRHTTSMLGLARRTLNNVADADDVVQTVFIKLWQSPNRWQTDKSAFGTWLYRVVLNACYDLGRAKSRQRSARESLLEASDAGDMQVSDTVDHLVKVGQQRQREQQMQAAIGQLPSAQREAINLAVFTGLSQKEVAQVLDISVKAVESLLVRAKRNLKSTIATQPSASPIKLSKGEP